MPPAPGGWDPVVYTTGRCKLELYVEEKCLAKMNALKLTLSSFENFLEVIFLRFSLNIF